ncbi:MAG: ATP-binding protein [Clostridium sp.]|uniref:ATP-binding protein n=1 Tax=Clostridium sp. TaxID=1506 RepID=UPI002FC6F254
MKSIAGEILEEYEALRNKHKDIQTQRTEEVYSKAPVIREIDRKIVATGFEIASNIFKLSKEGIDPEEYISYKKAEIESLKRERAVLLTEKGYSPNYLDLEFTCETCKDTGYVGEKKCNCFKQKLINKYFKQSNITNVIQRENFNTFSIDFYSTVKSETYGKSPRDNMMVIFPKCVDYCETFNSIDTNLLFTGSTGLGKTFLCNCISREILRKGKSVVYNTASSLIDIIRNIKYSDEDKSKLDYIMNCDLLIIDDLGTENITQSSQGEIFNILNERLLLRKKVIISTNLSLEELQMKYHPRIVSRIVGSFDICEFFGEDIRIIQNSHKVK